MTWLPRLRRSQPSSPPLLPFMWRSEVRALVDALDDGLQQLHRAYADLPAGGDSRLLVVEAGGALVAGREALLDLLARADRPPRPRLIDLTDPPHR